MKAKVKFLNVGWGDAHLIQMPSGCVTLIDGGDGVFSQELDHPLSWMNRNGIEQLDWMILTHIHEDHVNGLLDIAKVKPISKAILPYEPFELPPVQRFQERGNDHAMRVFRMLESYLELIQVLRERGAEIIWRSEYASSDRSVVWSEEGVSLTYLYPWEEDPLPAYEALLQALSNWSEGLDGADITETLPEFFELSNHDSSVFRLTYEQEPESCVLFGGDQLEPGWERLAKRTDIRSRIWKVSHHGVDDGFNARLLTLIQPEHCIIAISVERSLVLQGEWNELRSLTNASFYMTGDFAPGNTRRIDNGSISVEIGF